MCREEVSKSQHTQATAVSCVRNISNSSIVNMNSSSNETDPNYGDQQTPRVSTPSSLLSSQTLIVGRFRVSPVNEPTERLSDLHILNQNNPAETDDVMLSKRDGANSEAPLLSNFRKQNEYTDELLFNFRDSSENKHKKSVFAHLKPFLKRHSLLPRL